MNPGSPSAHGRDEHLSTAARHGLTVRYAMGYAMDLPLECTRFPRGVGSALAVEYGVRKYYPYQLWAEVSEKLADRKTLDLSHREGSGQPINLTPTQRQRIMDYALENRTLAIRQLKEASSSPDLNSLISFFSCPSSLAFEEKFWYDWGYIVEGISTFFTSTTKNTSRGCDRVCFKRYNQVLGQ